MAAPVRMGGGRRYRRPPPTRAPVLTKTYAWKVITLKVWWPSTGSPPGWSDHPPGY